TPALGPPQAEDVGPSPGERRKGPAGVAAGGACTVPVRPGASDEVHVAAQVVGLVHVRGLPDGEDHVAAAAVGGVDRELDVLGRGVAAGLVHQFQAVPGQRLGGRVEALLGDVDQEVVCAVAGLVVQVDGEGVVDVGGLPRAYGVHGAVAAAFGEATAAQLAVGEGSPVVAADPVAVQAVPVPHGVGVVLPGLPAHGVFVLHVGVEVVVAPTQPATVVTGRGVDDRPVGGRGGGPLGQPEKGCEEDRESPYCPPVFPGTRVTMH